MPERKFVAFIDLPPEKEHVYLYKKDKVYDTWLWTRDLQKAYRFNNEYQANQSLLIATADFKMNAVALTGSMKVKPEVVEANNMNHGHDNAYKAGELRFSGPGAVKPTEG